MLQTAAGLGFAGVTAGLSLLIFACAGLDAALDFCPGVIVLGLASITLSLLASRRSTDSPDAEILAGLFLGVLAILGGGLELIAVMHWPILFVQH